MSRGGSARPPPVRTSLSRVRKSRASGLASRTPNPNLSTAHRPIVSLPGDWRQPFIEGRTKEEHFLDRLLGPWHSVTEWRWCRRRRPFPCPSLPNILSSFALWPRRRRSAFSKPFLGSATSRRPDASHRLLLALRSGRDAALFNQLRQSDRNGRFDRIRHGAACGRPRDRRIGLELACRTQPRTAARSVRR